MARIDSLIAALYTHKGDELFFRTGAGVTVRVGTQSREIVHKPLSQPQIDAVLREIMPPTEPIPVADGSTLKFHYRAPAGRVHVAFERFRSHATVSVTPAPLQPGQTEATPAPAGQLQQPPAATYEYQLPQILTLAAEQGATDIHLRPGSSPIFRVGGELSLQKSHRALDAGFIEKELLPLAPPDMQPEFETRQELEFWFVASDKATVRATVLRERLGVVAVLRFQPQRVPQVDTLGFWKNARDLFEQRQGLLLVASPSGNGKSTTLASTLDYLGRARTLHVLTIEEYIKYPLAQPKGLLTQRQVGTHVTTTLEALAQALHSDVDVVALSTPPTAESWKAALALAEAGKLVFVTVTAATATGAVAQVLEHFPPTEVPAIQARLSRVFAGATAQVLLPRKGGGRIAAMETLVSVPAVRDAVRRGRLEELTTLQAATHDAGSITMDEALAMLVLEGKVEEEQALRFVTTPAAFFARTQPGDSLPPQVDLPPLPVQAAGQRLYA